MSMKTLSSTVLYIFLLCLVSGPAQAWKIAAGTVTVNDPTAAPGFQPVSFTGGFFDVAPVVFVLAKDIPNNEPRALRIQNVTTAGFEIIQVRPTVCGACADGGGFNIHAVNWIAIEPGQHPLPGGGFIEVGTVSTATVQKKFAGAEGWDTIAFSSAFPNSAVAMVGQVQTTANGGISLNGGQSNPFITTAIRNANASNFQTALELSEVVTALPLANPETIGWLAAPSGLNDTLIDTGGANVLIEALLSADSITHTCTVANNFSNTYSTNPLVVASKNRLDGGDGGWMRECLINTAAVRVRVQEDRGTDTEVLHTTESAGIFVVEKAFDADVSDVTQDISSEWKIEAGIINDPGSLDWTTSFTQSFKQSYNSPPLVFVMPDALNPDPTSVRVFDVTTTGFTAALVEPPKDAGVNTGQVNSTNLHYIAITPGVNTFPDGTQIEAGTVFTNRFLENSALVGTGSVTVPLQHAYSSTPVVLADVQTRINEPALSPLTDSVPWLETTIFSVTPANFQLALELAEVDNAAPTSSESIAYLAMDDMSIQGQFSCNTINDFCVSESGAGNMLYEAQLSSDSILGWADVIIPGGCPVFNFLNDIGNYIKPIVVASQNRRDGNNGGWVRRCGITTGAPGSVSLIIDEDIDGDAERNHTTENAGFLAFDEPFFARFTRLIGEWRFDEGLWSGVAGEVIDSSTNGHNGQAQPAAPAGPTTAATNSALAGNPGTCNYGEFDGVDDYLTIADDNQLDISRELTITAWINPDTISNVFILRKGLNYGLRLFNNARIVWEYNNASAVSRTLTSTSKISALNTSGPRGNGWHHIAVVYSFAAGTQTIYINGVADASSAFSEQIQINANDLFIASQDGSSRFFDGQIDEVRIYNSALTASDIQTIMNKNRVCGADHYAISYPDSFPGVTCDALTVDVEGHDSGHNPVNPPGTTLNINATAASDPAKISWAIKNPIANPGAFVDNGDGTADYTFTGTEPAVQFSLKYPLVETFNLNVTDGIASEDLGEDGNAQFVGSAFRITANPAGITADNVTSKIAGKPSGGLTGSDQQTLFIQAIQTDTNTGSCVGVFQGAPTTAVSIEMAAECENPALCVAPAGPGTAVQVQDNTPAWVNIGINDSSGGVPSNYQAITLDFDSNSAAPLVFRYFDAGKLSLHMRYDLNPPNAVDYMFGASNSFGSGFVVRPFGFTIDVPTNPAAVDANGLRFTAAGAPFAVNVTAVAWNATGDDGVPSGTANDGIPDGHDDSDPANNVDLSNAAIFPVTPNYGRESPVEVVSLSALLDQPSGVGVADPGLSGTTTIGSFTAGSGSTGAAQYNEVGIIEIAAATDTNYLSLGAGETAKMISKSGYVGRFTPARFDAQVINTPAFADSCTGFSYQDQPFNYGTAPILEIRALAANGSTTVNYGNNFWKFPTTTQAIPRIYADGHPVAPAAVFQFMAGDDAVVSGNADFDGIGRFALKSGPFSGGGDVFTYQRISEEGVFNADVDVTFLASSFQDSDHTLASPVCYDKAPPDGICDDLSLSMITGTELRWGRLVIGNNFGSELLPLAVPFRTEYFDGSSFVVNMADNCTGIAASDLSLSNNITAGPGPAIDITNLPACGGSGVATGVVANNPFSNGEGGLTFSVASPASSCTGYADISVDLSTGTGLNMEWLLYDWDGLGGFNDEPRGRVSFGVYQGPREFIYQREPWN